MIMSNIAAFAVQNTSSSEVEMHSQAAESMALHRVVDELKYDLTCKIVLASGSDFLTPATKWYSSVSNITVQTACDALMHPRSGCRLPPRCRIRYRSIHRLQATRFKRFLPSRYVALVKWSWNMMPIQSPFITFRWLT